MRWTAPMNAPSPPPTIPMRSLRFQDSMMSPWPVYVSRSQSASAKRKPWLPESQDLAVRRGVALAPGEIIEGHLGCLDDVPGDERSPFPRPLVRTLDTALPFHDGPAIITRL